MFNSDLVALVDIETSVFKNRPEVLACCAVRHVADENLGRLPEQNILRIHPLYRSPAIIMIRSITSSVDQLTVGYSQDNLSIIEEKSYELESSTLSRFPLYASPPSFLTACWAL